MHSVAGIFLSATEAAHALERIRRAGFAEASVNLLVPGSSTRSVPTETAEQPGMGRAIGSVAGGAAGAGWGMLAAAAIGVVPGVGPVLAVGVVAGILAGIGGAAAGQAIEGALTHGVPKDELVLYEEALRQGRAVVIVVVSDADRAEEARAVLADAGAEALDDLRVGLIEPPRSDS